MGLRSTEAQARCYFCGQPATTVEHVPPKCLFPESKDIADRDYRKNLVTVPSCDEHNTGKSRDDEFLMACLAPVVGNNGTAFIHTNTKIARAGIRNPRLVGEIMRDAKSLDLVAPGGTRFPVLVGEPDLPRLCRSLEAVARALFYHAKGERFVGTVTVMPCFINFDRCGSLSLIQLIGKRMMDQERHAWKVRGDNPEIFAFQIGPVDQYGFTPMVMTFYAATEVMVAFQPEGVAAPHRSLSDASPENPIEVQFTVGEGDDVRKIVWRYKGE
jgi:hypothetical protein